MLTVILKGTNGCNLNCSYCSVGEKRNIQKVDEHKLTEILSYVCELCRAGNEDIVSIILHGGEPTLIDPSIYEGAIERAKKNYPDISLKIFMQTNGYKFDERYIEFISKYDISVGVSIDFPGESHDLQRRTVANTVTFDRVSKNILTLLEHGISVSCLTVLTQNTLNLGYGYLDFLEKNNLHLKINPLLNYGNAYGKEELALKEGQYADYLIDLFKYIVKNDLEVSIAPLDKILQGIVWDQKIRECSFDPSCNYRFLCIDHKGDIYPCGKYSDMDEFKLGNISQKRYDLNKSSKLQMLLSRRNEHAPEDCRGCRYRNLCNCGCNADASIGGGLSKVPPYCKDYKKIFDFFHGEGLVLLKEKLIQEKGRN